MGNQPPNMEMGGRGGASIRDLTEGHRTGRGVTAANPDG
jgi:hypothetical protein